MLGDPKTLYPNVIETITAAKVLVKEGFDVMVYTSDDPIIAKELEDIGLCCSHATRFPYWFRYGHFEPLEFADYY